MRSVRTYLDSSRENERGLRRRGWSRNPALGGLPVFVLLAVGVAVGWSLPAEAQWVTQSLTLSPGWNAVFLSVEPEPGDCASVFAGLPIESVWFWSPDRSTVQFVRDPNKLMPDDPDWRVWFPENSLARAATTLRVMRGNRPYMIKVSGSASVNWLVRGKPSMRTQTWIPDTYNLVGFQTDPAGAPTVQKLFAGSSAHAGQAVFRLRQNTQTWEEVAAPESEKPNFGEAVWVYTKGTSTYQGPLRVESPTHGELDFGRGGTELQLDLHNDGDSAKTCSVRVLDSETPPASAGKRLAGAVPLSYWKTDYANNDVGWNPCDNAKAPAISVETGKYAPLRLSVRRRDMSPAMAMEGSEYQSVVQVSDGAGMLIRVPITALSLRTTTGAKSAEAPLAGLWVGQVTVNEVSQPEMHGAHFDSKNYEGSHAETVTDEPQPTGSEFTFTLIVHVDASGQARLLQQVTLMWQDGTYKPDPMFSGGQVVDKPGHYVLITDESLLSKFKGSSMRGGVSVGQRFSSPAFTWSSMVNNQLVDNRELNMTGPFPMPAAPAPATPLTCTFTLGYDDRLNPYKHIYHPDHNNLDEYGDPLDPAKVKTESWDITRTVSLGFIDYSKSGTVEASAYAGWGDKWIGGIYRETIVGMHRTPLRVAGTFRLNYVSSVAELNPEK